MDTDPPDFLQLICTITHELELQAIVAEREQLESMVAPVLAELERIAATP